MEDHALVASIFFAATVEAALNLYIAIPVLYIRGRDLRKFFGTFSTQYQRLPIP